MSGISDASAFDAFNRMAEKIEESERRTVAAAELDEALQLPDVEREFRQLESGMAGVAVDDRLMALKQQMGLLPSSAPAETRQIGAGGKAAAGNVQDGEVEIEEDDAKSPAGGKDVVAEAELLAQFEKLEQQDSR
jgi:phage shock protein A